MLQILLKNAPPITVEAVVRTVPRQREVIRGVWNNQLVYAKKFIGSRAQKHFARDLAGVKALVAANIATPPLLFQGETQDGDGLVAIFGAIENAPNAEESWAGSSEHARFSLMHRLVQTVALHHQAGLLQTDLYLKNFLVQPVLNQEDLIYTLDGDGIRSISPWFKQRQKLRNLATLFSKMDVLDDGWITALYAQYCLQLGITHSPADVAEVWDLTQKIRHQVATGYADKKVFRNCTDVKVTRSFNCFQAVAADFCVESQALTSLDVFLAETKLNIKNGNTCTVGKVALAGQSVIIKRYNIKNFWHGLNRAFRVSRAAKSWANAYRLIISNIATAKPLALIEERLGCFRRRAYYLSEYIDAPDVMQFFAQSTKLEDRQTVVRNLATLFYKLYLLKLSHGDCKASNIKIVNLAPILIDLDGMQTHFGGVAGHWWFERKHIKDLKRLMKNWANDAEVTHLLKQAFVQKYTAQHPGEDDRILIRAGMA
ncbi:MAG: lipopolysaccharide kinase InaA family protein [Methylotenera sp.]|nr:lipopolysaccharide kinase InaA family protein [Methylotenera sp.]MDD4925184.1 lipopolysaccharide kinase InaA family protein [Methylotenera sp.]